MLRRGFTLAFLASAILHFGALTAHAEKRVALVIGNSSYQHVTKLPNPPNDVTAIGLLLKSAGFEVVETRQDLGATDMRRAIRDFSDVAREADMAVIFYAGHGIEVDGVNYLVPVDATLERDIDVEDETVSLDRVLQVIEPAKRLRLVILDACRDNPFRAMKRTLATRSIGRGLARVEPVKSDTLIAFAAKAGSVAADGGEIHSPFTAALLKHLAAPGLDLRIAFGRVRDEVMKSTGNRQEPFVYGSLGGTTVALNPSHQEKSQREGSSARPVDPSSNHYELAAKVGTKEAWSSFLAQHPSGFYADLAKAQLAKLHAAEPPPRPVEQTRPPARPPEIITRPTSDDINTRIVDYIQWEFLQDKEQFADLVDYYDKGFVDRNFIAADKFRFAQKWPHRNYSLVPGTLRVVAKSGGEFAVTYSYEFEVVNGAKRKSGRGTTQVILRDIENTFLVVGVKEAVQR